jgi:hypothetical protein
MVVLLAVYLDSDFSSWTAGGTMFQREKASITGITGMHFRFMVRKLNKASHAVKQNHR